LLAICVPADYCLPMTLERADAVHETGQDLAPVGASKVAEGAFLGVPGSGGALARALRAGVPVSNRAAARLLQRQESGYGYEFSDDPLVAGGFGPSDATIRVRPGPVRSTLIRPRPNARPASDAARPELERLLSDFAAAKPDEKAAIAMRAVEAVIRAYGLSRRGVTGMSYDPKLTVNAAETSSVGDKARSSTIAFGPETFTGGWEWLVHTVSHELEHVRQELIGGYDKSEYITGDWPGEQHPLKEFRAYSGEVLEVGTTEGPGGRGLLGAMMAPDKDVPLPPLPPDKLALTASRVLKYWRAMKPAQRKAAWVEFQGVRDKLLERMAEAPVPLRPPQGDHASPAFKRWLDGHPPNSDPFSAEYQDWLEAGRSPAGLAWSKVKDEWRKFEAELEPK